MSQVPAQPPAYVRTEFDPASPIDPKCPLCWDNGMLAGGRVLDEGEVFFLYVFETEGGRLKDCFIAPKQHHPDMTSLPPSWGEEFGRSYALLRSTFGIGQHNGYWNEGYTAGQRIMGHWHVRIDEVAEGLPASGMGLA